jgi:uncharacterized cupin superfamily protein
VVPETPLEQTEAGLVPAGEGWFVLNAREAQWRERPERGFATPFEGAARFPQVGIRLYVLGPGEPMGMYHWESAQEDFLVLSGECLLIVEGQERPLKAWDFVHCPPWTEHIFVGAGDGPCVVLGVGARRKGRGIVYPVNETASRHGAGVDEETSDPRVAYARFSEDTPVSGHEVFPG